MKGETSLAKSETFSENFFFLLVAPISILRIFVAEKMREIESGAPLKAKRDRLLHDLVEHYAEITPNVHAKNATQAAHKIGRGASRRGQFWASGVSRFLRTIWV